MNRWFLPIDDGASVEVTVRRDVVEVRHLDRCVAVIDRDRLRGWLARTGSRRLLVDDVTWIGAQSGQIMLMVTRGGSWTLTPDAVHHLIVQL